MTREEAISWLEAILSDYDISKFERDAIDMAISALQEPSDYIEGDIDFHCDLKHNRMTWFNNITESANDVVEKNDEVIERPIIEHDREWIIGCIKHDGFIKTDRFDKANQIILEALEQTEPSDLISRADAIKAINDLHGGCITDNVKDITEYVLLGLPSVSAERVVRCKDCDNRHTDDCPMYYEEWYEIDEGAGYVDNDFTVHDYSQDDGFCSWAKMKGGAE